MHFAILVVVLARIQEIHGRVSQPPCAFPIVFNRSVVLEVHLDDETHRRQSSSKLVEVNVLLASPREDVASEHITSIVSNACSATQFVDETRWGPTDCTQELTRQILKWKELEVQPWRENCLCLYDRQACPLPDVTRNEHGRACSYEGVASISFHVDPSGNWDSIPVFDNVLSVRIEMQLNSEISLAMQLESIRGQFHSECDKRGGSQGVINVNDCVRVLENQVIEWVQAAPHEFPWRIKCEGEGPNREREMEVDFSPMGVDIDHGDDIEALREELARLRSEVKVLKEAKNTHVPFGIYPMLRDMGCTHGNMQTPRLLTGTPGNGRFIIDIGLGELAIELIEAVDAGFNILGFELLPANVAKIRDAHGENPRVMFVDLEMSVDGRWELPSTVEYPPPLTADGRGFAYIFLAGLDDTIGSAHFLNTTGVSNDLSIHDAQGGEQEGVIAVPVGRLEDLLPVWATRFYLLKIDTQGWELRILKGVVNELRSRRFDYVLFEFSPWLMMRSQSGDPMELIELIPALGGVCFDSLDSLNTYSPLSRPSSPLRDYVEQLQSALYQNPEKPFGEMTDNDLYGPWDDVLCAFI